MGIKGVTNGALVGEQVIDALLGRNADVLLLAKFYASDRPDRFVQVNP